MNLNTAIAGYGKVSSSPSPRFSSQIVEVINEAKKNAVDYISIPLLLLGLLSLPKISKLIENYDPVNLKTIELQVMFDDYFFEIESNIFYFFVVRFFKCICA